MARYIDADKLIAHLKDEIEGCKPPFGGRECGKSIAYGTSLGLKSAIAFAETLPTADVAPRAEERWAKNLEMLKSGALGDDTLPETLLRYWKAQEEADYPYASENVKYFENIVRKKARTNMEKEQIVKALEVCANYQNFGDCDKCPAREGCDSENSFLEKTALTLIREQEKRIEEIKADTVRKMHESIKESCIKGGIYPAFVASTIDRVAKELSEDVTPAKLLSLEDVSRAIKDYCCDLIDAGKDMVEVTEFNADLQKILKSYIGDKTNGTP